MNYIKPLPPPRALDMSFFSCVPAEFLRAGAKREPVCDPAAEALAEVMPKKPKAKLRKARLPLDKS